MYGKLAPDVVQQAEIVRLYESGLRLQDVAKRVGFCISTVTKFMKLNGAARRIRGTVRGSGRVDNYDDDSLAEHKEQWDKLGSTVKGSIAETHVKTRLSELGFDVWEPFCQNHTTDMLILSKKSMLRIQVKSATYDLKTKAFRANVTRRRRKDANGKRGVVNYSLDEVDFFIIFCGGMDSHQFYVTPADLLLERKDMKMYPHRDCGHSEVGPDWESFRNAFHLLRPDRAR